jgi:cobalt-zinc-cadmium efflux system outer membrane protein
MLTTTLVVSAQQPPVPAGPLSFDRALALATARNLNVEAARRARAIREAAIRTARQAPNPAVSFETAKDTPHQALSVDVPVELGGRRSHRIDLAKEELTLAEVDVQMELRAVRRDVRQSFYGLLAADERVRLAEDVIEIVRRLHDAAQARFEAGAAPRLEVLIADLAITRSETDIELARSIRIASQATLDAVLNLPPQQTLTVAGNLYERVPVLVYEQALATAVASNIDLVTLDRQIAIESRRLALLRAERTPTPIFSAGALFNAPGEFDVGSRFGVSIDLPLFSRNQGEIAASIATTAQLRTKREATARVVENQVYGTLARVEAVRRQVEAYEQRLVPIATDLESLAEESYRAGRTSVLGLLEAQRSLRDLRRESLQAALDLQLALADLEEVIGTPIQ